MELQQDQVAVVTGAASGIGLALAESLAKAGCNVVLADIDEGALGAAEKTVATHGTSTMITVTDVADRSSVDSLVAATIERFGRVDILCNNAGIAVAGNLDPWNGSFDIWEQTVGVNFFGVVHGTQAFMPHLVAGDGGYILNTASIAGLVPAFGGPYSASKAAVVSMSESLHAAIAEQGLPLGISCLCPGWVRTNIMRNAVTKIRTDPASAAVLDLFSKALDEGSPPALIADLCIDAIRDNRFWVFPHQDFLDLAIERFHRIADGLEPAAPAKIPGAPSTEEVKQAVLEAMSTGG